MVANWFNLRLDKLASTDDPDALFARNVVLYTKDMSVVRELVSGESGFLMKC